MSPGAAIWSTDFLMLKWPLPGGRNGNMKYRCVPSAATQIGKISVRSPPLCCQSKLRGKSENCRPQVVAQSYYPICVVARQNRKAYAMSQSVVINPPVRGQWAILNPPGHARLAFDFLAVDDRKSPYSDVSLFRHIVSTISVDATLAWDKPVFAVMDGTVVLPNDGVQDRKLIYG